MRMKNSYLMSMLFFVAALLSIPSVVSAQYSIPESTFEYGSPSPLGIGVHAGTTGFGVHVSKNLGQHFGARVGFSHMPLDMDILGTYANREVRTDLSARSTNVSLIFGWTPFATHRGFFRSFGVQLGGAYFTQIKGTMTSRLKNAYKYGDILVEPDLVGTITADVAWKKTVNPYAGIGWSNIVIDNHFSLNVDLGMYYLSKPTVSMQADGLLEANVNNQATIQKNLENYRYLPRVEFGVTYRLK